MADRIIKAALIAALIGHLVAVIVTFGHAWNHITVNPRDPSGTQVIESTGCALFWPLYWSVQAWKGQE